MVFPIGQMEHFSALFFSMNPFQKEYKKDLGWKMVMLFLQNTFVFQISPRFPVQSVSMTVLLASWLFLTFSDKGEKCVWSCSGSGSGENDVVATFMKVCACLWTFLGEALSHIEDILPQQLWVASECWDRAGLMNGLLMPHPCLWQLVKAPARR